MTQTRCQRSQLQSCLLTSGSLSFTGAGEIADSSRSPSQQVSDPLSPSVLAVVAAYQNEMMDTMVAE